MISNKLLKDLSANTVQTGITQLAGLIIFYLMSKYLPKSDFGEYGWSTAVAGTLIAIGSLGLDLVLVKRIAAGHNAEQMTAVHLFHTLSIGVIILSVISLTQSIYPEFSISHPLLLLIIIQLLINNIANTFKFSLTGLEQFKALAITALSFNLLKLLAVALLLIIGKVSITYIIYGFIVASCAELALAYYYIRHRLQSSIRPRLHKIVYKGFILESLPQLGVVVFDSALARVDWILLGIFSTASITAEYSFAYKFFELSKIPLLILAPVLLTRFSKLVHQEEHISPEKKASIQNFFDLEIFISCLIPVIMVSCWSPLIDWVTENKYGLVNEATFRILALCIPLHFIINFYWTMAFVQGQLKQIMYITIVVSSLNILLNVFIIPRLGGLGAAYAFLGSTLVQLGLYLRIIRTTTHYIQLKKALFILIIAISSVYTSTLAFSNIYIRTIIAISLYSILLLASKQISLKQVFHFKKED